MYSFLVTLLCMCKTAYNKDSQPLTYVKRCDVITFNLINRVVLAPNLNR